jgi:antitoxin PrlF
MSETLGVSSRGQVTLPAALRKRLWIKSGGVVILDERGNEVVLKPGIVQEFGQYSDDEIVQWDSEDKISTQEQERIRHALTKHKK